MIEHSVEFRVRYAETDQMQFAHHSNYIIWFEMGRLGLMNSLGFAYDKLEDEGYLLPVIEVMANYIKPARFNNVCTLKTQIKEKPGAKLRFEYEVLNSDGVQLCKGHSLHSFMNKQDKAIKPPRPFLKKVQEYF